MKRGDFLPGLIDEKNLTPKDRFKAQVSATFFRIEQEMASRCYQTGRARRAEAEISAAREAALRTIDEDFIEPHRADTFQKI